ncbi:MAG: aminotransferase class I/II-fold pyridoxal phosphate-dependent enzyme [Clostridia bacterium]|nr:aminotransferase class I/II-fold pyridoxal phosphate-dependent enzyme [Clostridia bacterium]
MLYKTDNTHGGDIYGEDIELDFSASVNPLGAPESVKAAVRRSAERISDYPDPRCRALTEAAAAYEHVKCEHLIFGNGASELIYAYCAAAGPSRAVLTAPTFSEYENALSAAGCEVLRYALKRENGFALDRGFLDYILKNRPDAVFLANPNNPTGRLIDAELLGDIFALCKAQNVRLFLDECFIELSHGGMSMSARTREYGGLFILKAFTKSFAMAGLRLGYAITCDEELLMKMSARLQPWNVSLCAQEAGAAALGEREFLKKSREYIAAERLWMEKKLESLGFWVCPSDANFLLFYGREGLSKALKPQRIAIRGCENFSGLGAGWYRVSVRRREDNEKLMRALSVALGGI